MHKKLMRIKAGQISVEASIIAPIVIIIMASLLSMAFYAHDVISIRCGAYSMAIEENNKNQMPGLFVIRPKIVKTEKTTQWNVNVSMDGIGNTNFIHKIIRKKGEEVLAIQKTMNAEILYGARAFLDMKREGGD